ncbi:MauE/DoxX family redox-associated membrane protein [Streptomyces sp. NPDC007863]|uniref:MauE/DoxX family redox-associated membrane protein n=1 Tax=Streptomyces sp. NPDC007863 TaxID=3154894 RepID=UPI00340C3924
MSGVVYVVIACRALLALVFLASAAGKLRGRDALAVFTAEVRAWRLVPAGASGAVAAGVAGAEAVAAVLSALPAAGRSGPVLGGLLVAVFTAGIVVTRARGTTARCSCFGRTAVPLGRRHLVRNGFLLAAAGLALLPVGEPSGAPAVVVAVGAGAAAALLVVTLDEIVGLFAASEPSAPSVSSPASSSVPSSPSPSLSPSSSPSPSPSSTPAPRS